MRSVLLDNSFCLRLVSETDPYHQNVKNYFKYFIENQIIMYLSSITFAEYCVRNSPQDFPLQQIRQITFDMRDAAKAGKIWEFVHSQKLAQDADKSRDTIKDDCKLFAQICNRQIDAFISKDQEAYSRYIQPIIQNPDLTCKFEFIDLTGSYEKHFKLDGPLFG